MTERDESISSFLDRLADRTSAPGGGASAAIHAAQAAALVSMVARYSDGPKFAEHAESIAATLEGSERLRRSALVLAGQDEAAFAAVAAAYKLPKDTDEQRRARSTAIAAALAEAARPPADVITTVDQILGLAEQLLPIGNRNLITDLAAAAEAGRAAANTARVNVEVNLGGIKDPALVAEYERTIELVDRISDRADQVTAAVREAIRR